MAIKLRVPKEIFKMYQGCTLEECLRMYRDSAMTLKSTPRCILRALIAKKAIYGDDAYKGIPNPNYPMIPKHADKGILSLYKELPLDKCILLYKMQHDNVDCKTRFAVRTIIGAKLIYGENYGKLPENRIQPVQFSK